MIRGYYTARTGLMAHQQRIDVIANNIANINTVGYKSMRPSFKDLIYQNVNRPDAEDFAMTGHGVKVNTVDIFMEQGRLEPTDRSFDIALTGEGDFFMVETPSGETLYTRAGNFYASLEDDEFYLVDSNRYYVLDADGERIDLPLVDGKVEMDPSRIGVARVPNPYAMNPVGDNCFELTVAVGEPEIVEMPAYKVGYLEGSGVYLPTEMTAMIEASKAFSLNARMSMVADEIEQTVNSLR